jgi:hypothetical protein
MMSVGTSDAEVVLADCAARAAGFDLSDAG